MEDVVQITIEFYTMLLDLGEKSYLHDVTLAIFKFAANLHQFHNLSLLKEHNDLPSRSSWKQNIMLLIFKIASGYDLAM